MYAWIRTTNMQYQSAQKSESISWEVAEWDDMQQLTSEVRLTEENDARYWLLTKNKNCSSKSFYLDMLNPGARDARLLDCGKQICC